MTKLKPMPQEEVKVWQEKIANSVSAEPLAFERAEDGNAPFHLEVTNGQAPGGGRTLIIHVFKRADMHKKLAEEIVRHALVDVFGADAGSQAECDYRDVKELRDRYGADNVVNEAHDSLTVIFPPGPIAYSRPRAWVRDQMAAALVRWYQQSRSW